MNKRNRLSEEMENNQEMAYAERDHGINSRRISPAWTVIDAKGKREGEETKWPEEPFECIYEYAV